MQKLIDIGRELLWPVLCALVMVVIGLTSANLNYYAEKQRVETAAVEANKMFAEHFFSHLQIVLDPAESTTEVLANLAQSKELDFSTPSDQWLLDQFAENAPRWRNLSVAPDNCISAVAPRAGNEGAVGYCLTSNPDEAVNIARIMETRKPTFFGPIELAQDSQGFIYDYPVFLADGSYWGMTTAVIDKKAFEETLRSVAKEGETAVRLTMTNPVSQEPQLIFDTFSSDLPFQATTEFVSEGATFTLVSAPRVVDYSVADIFFYRLFFGSVIFAIIIFFAVYFIRKQGRTSRKLSMLTKRSPSAIFSLGVSKTGYRELTYISEGCINILGYKPDELIADSAVLLNRMDVRDLDAGVARMSSVKSPGEIWSQRLKYQHPDKGQRWLQVEAVFERTALGESQWNGIFVDVTTAVEQEQQLSVSAGVFTALNDGVAILDAQWKVIDINPGITRNTGYTRADLFGKDFSDFGSGLNTDALYASINTAVQEYGYWRGEVVNRHKSGHISKDFLTFSSVIDSQGELTQIIVVMNSIEKMLIDSVTGLPNRTHFEEHLAEAVERAKDDNNSLALIEVSIAGVGAVNDSFGYKIGDLLLHEIGERVAEFSADNRSVGRIGDTTFGIIRHFQGNPAQLEEVCNRLLGTLAVPFIFDDVSVLVSTSIGIATLSKESSSVEELRSHAGQAAKVALEQGGQQFQFFSARMETGAKVRSYLTSDLQEAVKNESLSFHYQPIVRLSDRQIIKAEALARWFDEHLGEVSPGRFIPLAEESGLIHEIGAQLFAACADTAVQLQKLGRPIAISLNVSPVEIMSAGFNREEELKLAIEGGLDPNNLVFELTEGILLNRRDLIEERIRRCRQMGIKFAIDDFGTGYSSLSYLQQLEVDYIKIDKTFIDRIETAEGFALCRSIIELAHALGLELIAEGVESENQVKLLLDLGCEYAQGYLFSPAVTKRDFLELLGFKQD